VLNPRKAYSSEISSEDGDDHEHNNDIRDMVSGCGAWQNDFLELVCEQASRVRYSPSSVAVSEGSSVDIELLTSAIGNLQVERV
jgi:hypothetical protein